MARAREHRQLSTRQGTSETGQQRLSVVIPTLNEASHLPGTLQRLAGAHGIEIIVVDGGSDDGTPEIAQRAGCRVVSSARGRALQLNAGADAADGSLLLFLHADTQLPTGFDTAVRSALAEPGVAGGAFRLRIDAPGWPFRLIEQAVAIRSRLFQMPYGDQGIFVRAETFRQIGGFPALPIMDDFEFIRHLRRRGRVRVLSLPATTSGRRWRKLGCWRTTWINQKVVLGYYLGVAPERLAKWYGISVDSNVQRAC
jgi:rSAM/selenodomain-associated transferase 2